MKSLGIDVTSNPEFSTNYLFSILRVKKDTREEWETDVPGSSFA